MKNHNLFLTLVLVTFLLLLGVWILSFFRSSVAVKRISATQPASAAPTPSSAAGPQALFNPPRPEDAPEKIRPQVLLGYKIMTETQKYATGYAGNALSCSSCHFDGGRSLESIPLVGTAATYPQYRSRQKYTTDLALRVQDCFERSMNGKAPALDSQIMQSLLVYLQWISKDIPVYAKLPWALPHDLGNAHKPDQDKGAQVYVQVCARCHGDDGQGTDIAPPLWGEGSYNDGAGMHRVRTFSVFTWKFMPKSAPSLSQEEALDVAAFVNSRPRPKFVASHPETIERVIPLPEGK
ncbi:c-type cytochrome [Desulfovibrio legallii]|jgi:thiosulfate dehydrogenase|uniref:Thiosulfate dehydrogenase n=1 Tax=Desulfovibrio legallii TaxID=571438 RepID=A0A1G7KBZ4_9BACT|nr:c-type cytochrome [Desulfovibrio legallii]SDF34672.1 thiosulfate dehydrogenase [Desulfovibrio legallii]